MVNNLEHAPRENDHGFFFGAPAHDMRNEFAEMIQPVLRVAR
jgi:hypothetical protein